MRERDRNKQMFHKGHYEVIAARFRENVVLYVDSDGEPWEPTAGAKLASLKLLASCLADRFEFDSELFDRKIFLERCGFVDGMVVVNE